MDSLTVVLIVVCAVLLILLVWALGRKGKKSDLSDEIANLNALISEKDDSIARLKSESENESQRTQELIDKLREKNIRELKESADRISELESEISKALTDGVDDIVRKKLDEADKLLKKVKNLEDDLEEAEDEIDSLKKKNKNLQSENSELNESVDNEIRKGKKLVAEINEIKNRLIQVEKDFSVREEALDFVKEILTADRTSDESVRSLYQTVDGLVDYIRGEVRDCLTSIYELSSEQKKAIFDTELVSWAISKKKSWIQGKTAIAFVGEFSAGKTSIVNRILSQDNPDVPRLPVSTKATTAIPTYISGGVSTYYQFVTPDNELKSISEDTFKRVNKEVLDQVKGVSSLIQYFVMTYKNPNLDRLSILDTPGFNSYDSEDSERTVGVINECDALFWVFDVNAGTVNRASIKIIKENLTKPLFVVINQIDTKSKSDVDAVENLIRKTLSDEGVKIEGVIRFSKKEPLENIMQPILAIKHDNSREVYLEELIAMLADRVKSLANDTRNAQKKSNSLENKSSRLRDTYKRALNNLKEDCLTVSEMPESNSRWFHEDDFRMSQEQYFEFKSILQRIAEEHTETLSSEYNEQMNTVVEMQQSWNLYSDARYKQKRLEECLETLKKRAKSFSASGTVYSKSVGNSVNTGRRQSEKQTSVLNDNRCDDYQHLSQNSNTQSSNLSIGKTYSTTEILDEFITNRKVNTSYNDVNIIVAWNKLFRFINERLHYEVSKDEMRAFIPDFGKNGYAGLWNVSVGLERLLTFYVLRKDIRSCARGSINEKYIIDCDIDWTKLLALLNSRYGIDMKKSQLINPSAEKSIEISQIIERIQVNANGSILITAN